MVRFAGVALTGGKTDKTAVAIVEYYPERRRVFLRSLRERVGNHETSSVLDHTRDHQMNQHHEGIAVMPLRSAVKAKKSASSSVGLSAELTADEALLGLLAEEESEGGLKLIALDAPLQLPICIRCDLRCPGVMKCKEPAVQWMRSVHSERAGEKRPNKMFTPYTERATEIYIANALEEPFHPSHALGANAAPLTARAHFLRRRLKTSLIEVYPKLTLWRIGQDLQIPKSYLRFHRHAVDSDEARQFILQVLIEKEIAFIYQQDMRIMIENNHAFEAFICALTAFLKYRKQTVPRPGGFPAEESWIDFPRSEIDWF